MKVAIPVFSDEVSPRFGCSREVLLAEVEDGRVVDRQVRDVSAVRPPDLPAWFAERQVEKVICGGVNAHYLRAIEDLGIEVIWGVIGLAEEALDAFLAGRLQRDQFVCPGGRGGRRCRRSRMGQRTG